MSTPGGPTEQVDFPQQHRSTPGGAAAPKIVTKPRPAPRVPEHPIGTLLPGSNLTSKVEETARARLTAAGVNLVEERLRDPMRVRRGTEQIPSPHP